MQEARNDAELDQAMRDRINSVTREDRSQLGHCAQERWNRVIGDPFGVRVR
jgi:hypothetical protein